MYSVTIRQAQNNDKNVIHSPDVGDLKIHETKIVKAVDDIDSFTFSIYPDNPYYSDLHPFITLIEVKNELLDKVVFRGRCLEPTDKMDSEGLIYKEVICEGELAYLRDSYQRWGKWQNMTPKAFFSMLIDVHNSQVELDQQFEVGVVDVTNSTDNVYRYTSDEMDTYDTIKDKLIDRLGGEISVRYEAGKRKIDYLKQSGEKGNQTIEISKNLLSVTRKLDPTEIITVLKPLGAQLDYEDDNTDVSHPRLTIEAVNNGSPYLADEAKIASFGIQVGVEIWENTAMASNLKIKGQEFLDNQKTVLQQFQIDAVDLAPLDLSVDNFECGWRYDLYNPLMGIDEETRIIGQTIDINDPTASTMSIGDKFLSLEQYTHNLLKQIRAAENIRESIQKDLANANERISELRINTETETGHIENEITAVLDDMQLIVSGLQQVTDELTLSQADQSAINLDFESRLKALEGG